MIFLVPLLSSPFVAVTNKHANEKKKLTTKRFKSFVRRAGKRKKKEGFRNLYREWRVEVVGCYYREGDYMCLCLYLWVCFLFVFLFSPPSSSSSSARLPRDAWLNVCHLFFSILLLFFSFHFSTTPIFSFSYSFNGSRCQVNTNRSISN